MGFCVGFLISSQELSMRKELLLVFLDQRHLVICLKSIYLVRIKVCVIKISQVSRFSNMFYWFHGVLLIIHSIKSYWGTSLGGPGLRICLPMQGNQIWFLVRELGFHMLQNNESCWPQLLSLMPQLESLCARVKVPPWGNEDPHAATMTPCSQIYNFFFKVPECPLYATYLSSSGDIAVKKKRKKKKGRSKNLPSWSLHSVVKVRTWERI